MPAVSSKLLHAFFGELKFDELHLRRGLLGACWRDVHGVRSRKVHDVDRSSRMHLMWRGKVFNSCRSHRDIDMPAVFRKLLLAFGELKFDELHLRRGLLGACWRHVHGVRSRKVQESDRSSRVHPLSSKLLLAFGELNFDELHLHPGLAGA
jgi:hypothetical protein